MDDDRTLLELAAKAAGIDACWHTDYNNDQEAAHEGMWLRGERSPDNSKYWNPLRVDGDALRLAVKLCIDIMPPRTEDDDALAMAQQSGQGGVFEPQRSDPYAATRRAIVRAAAAMAQPTKEQPEPAHSWRADAVGASVYSDDFTTDVRLNISGDFEDSTERKAYADALAAKLNAASPRPYAEKAEPAVWLVTPAKRPGVVRACWTEPPTENQIAAAAYDGDIITPLYAAPQAPKP